MPNWYTSFPFSCVWCDVLFRDCTSLRLHVRVKHGFHCNSCVKEINSWEKFLEHSEHCEFSRENISYFKNKQNVQIWLSVLSTLHWNISSIYSTLSNVSARKTQRHKIFKIIPASKSILIKMTLFNFLSCFLCNVKFENQHFFHEHLWLKHIQLFNNKQRIRCPLCGVVDQCIADHLVLAHPNICYLCGKEKCSSQQFLHPECEEFLNQPRVNSESDFFWISDLGLFHQLDNVDTV